MHLAPWRSPLSRALDLNRSQPHSRYLQLATVTKEGFPANRTVVFRGFVEHSDRLKIVTDRRSEKIEEIKYQPWTEICWYFTETREQFRIFGNLILVDGDCSNLLLQQLRQETWQQLSDATRQQFTWAYPKQTRVEDNAIFSVAIPPRESILDNFCLLLLLPTRVDHLELRSEPHNRILYLLQDDRTWLIKTVNP
jgi:PPOX class probable FMN-dependent enzyme